MNDVCDKARRLAFFYHESEAARVDRRAASPCNGRWLDHAFVAQECNDGPCDFVAINRLTRRVFVRIMPAKTDAQARRFLRGLHLACPILSAKMQAGTGKRIH